MPYEDKGVTGSNRWSELMPERDGEHELTCCVSDEQNGVAGIAHERPVEGFLILWPSSDMSR